ncbi:alpha/beta fold hydrolase [Streptomyces sp. NPDC059256]|uniref:alpha/beta fold hydrolase n=1 Tax=Streptomyces sp. NPDC059256 TaxID=3346794 RepID=UPI003686FD20
MPGPDTDHADTAPVPTPRPSASRDDEVPRTRTDRPITHLTAHTAEQPSPYDLPHGPLVTLFREAGTTGKVNEVLRLLAAAADLRDPPAGASPTPRRTFFADGPVGPALVCFPSLIAPAHAYQYARFATAFRERRGLLVLAPSGYTCGEPLPATLREFIDCQVTALRDSYLGDRPPVLVGHSSGGWVAHAIAEALAQQGTPPTGVVLLDTFLPDSPELSALQTGLFATLAETAGIAELTTESALSAMGRHHTLFRNWRPGATVGPTLLVRATDALNTITPNAAVPELSWPTRHEAINVPGNHLTMMSTFGPTTGRSVESWLSGQGPEQQS